MLPNSARQLADTGCKGAISPGSDCRLRIDAIDHAHSYRKEVEAFIQAGFARNYAASISSFMPCLVTLSGSEIRASLGVRPATQALFLEQYLNQPIDCTVPELEIDRSLIAEIGNLVSLSRHDTLRLFMLTFLALYRAGYKRAVFSATPRLAAILRRSGASLHPIVEVDGRRLGASLSQWGRYFDTHPVIMHLDIVSVHELIQTSSLLRHHCDGLIEFTDMMAQAMGKLR